MCSHVVSTYICCHITALRAYKGSLTIKQEAIVWTGCCLHNLGYIWYHCFSRSWSHFDASPIKRSM